MSKKKDAVEGEENANDNAIRETETLKKSANLEKNEIQEISELNHKGKGEKSKKERLSIPDKTTLNLCMKEKSLISPVLFLSILVVILAISAVIGYFGVYKQYERVRVARENLNQLEHQLNDLNQQISDYDSVKDRYNMYNYEDFDKTLADRQDILDLLKREVFPVCKVRSFSLSGRDLRIYVTGLTLDQVSTLISSLEADSLIEKVTVTAIGYNDSESRSEPTANFTITIADASKEGN